MNKLFTLVILFSCFKLSAAVHTGDTLKSTAPVINADSLNIIQDMQHRDSILFISFASKNNIARIAKTAQNDNAVPLTVENPSDGLRRLTSALQLDSLKQTVIAARLHQDSVNQAIKLNEQIKLARILTINDLDSLKQALNTTSVDTLKALLYTRIALKYLNYDTIANKKDRLNFQNQALNYTLQAIREYSRYNDSTSLRMSFDNLAKVYYAQKKYSQAKWFILQSNTLSRYQRDTINIIASLLTLSSIKSDIKDYNLAIRDLNEALQLTIVKHLPQTELAVLKNYASLYHRVKDKPREALMLKKSDSLAKSIHKTEQAQFMAKLAAQNALKKKKTDSLQNKKKVYTSSLKKLYKIGSSRKIASL